MAGSHQEKKKGKGEHSEAQRCQSAVADVRQANVCELVRAHEAETKFLESLARTKTRRGGAILLISRCTLEVTTKYATAVLVPPEACTCSVASPMLSKPCQPGTNLGEKKGHDLVANPPSLRGRCCVCERAHLISPFGVCERGIWPWVKIQIVPPVNIPIPTPEWYH